jgi:CRISPR-associated endoribonuclease Cas6
MPYSIVLKIFPKSEFNLREATGARLQGMFLELMRQVDSELAMELHDRPDLDEPTALRHYAVSPLFIERGSERTRSRTRASHKGVSSGGTLYWLHVAALDDRIYPALLRYLLGGVKREGEFPFPIITIDKTPFQIVEVLASGLSQHPWAGYSEVEHLITQASASERVITFEFKSPTVFERLDRQVPLPEPRLVWTSLVDRWNDAFGVAYSIPFEFIEVIENHVVVSAYHIHTQPFRQDDEIMLTGFVGQVTFRIIGSIAQEFIKITNLLADFALYSGIGKKTTRGMGMARRIL